MGMIIVIVGSAALLFFLGYDWQMRSLLKKKNKLLVNQFEMIKEQERLIEILQEEREVAREFYFSNQRN